ncbi:MAG: D-aminoacyl-tRNA deacylase [Candidatus Thiodiazotropha lotti]|uniref:D-aminoacyl-tRNA deacylase n=1 Tax=Candidatus Thiodiazotropha lotti TaxID=2792787 RepID=A0A9E4N2Q4_9GAMM|nr:D-aminoacyl-tRNA deacylase [Candidatus Thiodiazotropha lotti]ODC01783.1 D-tyrosyl-tRNA(Tyr) deacylase [Candidatus Thiodiazotropha endoloripes]MCG7921363.1 D-aminoacyl-tRNA deacylase [Candidatus Thiodiazotropha lotti]MCG7930329.1 D-aminoacyl-tRNA deacylase [Candidatus Thiodiazotropha lotti]MCG7941105.1 D-aminoacyl-tRNA deacylase [Candidatus Thiodiazotropha lotti]
MIGLLQRAKQGRVLIDGESVAEIGTGLVVLVGVEKGDDRSRADRLLQRLLGYRVFPDQQGRMNLSLSEIAGGLLLVPQFTLAADTRKGMRPGFSTAAEPQLGKELFSYLSEQAADHHHQVACGVFGADMQVALINDGPVTFWLNS